MFLLYANRVFPLLVFLALVKQYQYVFTSRESVYVALDRGYLPNKYKDRLLVNTKTFFQF